MSFIATSADEATRTFRVELEVPNPDGLLKDGVTAEFTVFSEDTNAYHLPRSSLVLNDDGIVGIRTLEDKDLVAFQPIRLLGEDDAGVWANGPEGDVRVITLGQDYVAAGETVTGIADTIGNKP